MSDTARPGPTSALVPVAQLAADLGLSPGTRPDPRGVVVVDCRFNLMKPEAGRADWLAGHIPGAFYADLDRDLAGPASPATGRHPLPDPERLRALFSSFGIGPETRVVAYDEGPGAIAARLWWLLRWMGHPHVALLDGGLAAWRAAGLPLATDAPAPVPGRLFTGQPGAMPTRDTATLAAALASGDGRLRLLDARAPDRPALYPGSWSEWIRSPDRPVAKGP